ncbi:MAG: hypothetical protein LAP86_34540 [Acidobacteriia bacterium]|nr:hypothetical protein [Terriglobia bacterium]
MPIAEPLIQSLKVLDVSGKMVQEHHIEDYSHDLRERRISLISGLFVMFEVLTADTDRENLLCPQANDRAERLLKAHTAITEKSDRGGISSRTGWKIKGIAADAQMWSIVILVATVTSRTRFHIG